MKTKTIYHLDQECNIVKIEVIAKCTKKSKRPLIIEKIPHEEIYSLLEGIEKRLKAIPSHS